MRGNCWSYWFLLMVKTKEDIHEVWSGQFLIVRDWVRADVLFVIILTEGLTVVFQDTFSSCQCQCASKLDRNREHCHSDWADCQTVTFLISSFDWITPNSHHYWLLIFLKNKSFLHIDKQLEKNVCHIFKNTLLKEWKLLVRS